FDASTGAETRYFGTGGVGAFLPSFSPDGKSLLAYLGYWNSDDIDGKPDEIRIWDVRTGAVRLKIRNENTRFIVGVCFSPDGQTIATCGYDTTLRLWDAQDGHELRVFRGHAACTNFAAFSPDGRRLASASDDGSARMWDIETGECLITLPGHRGAFD